MPCSAGCAGRRAHPSPRRRRALLRLCRPHRALVADAARLAPGAASPRLHPALYDQHRLQQSAAVQARGFLSRRRLFQAAGNLQSGHLRLGRGRAADRPRRPAGGAAGQPGHVARRQRAPRPMSISPTCWRLWSSASSYRFPWSSPWATACWSGCGRQAGWSPWRVTSRTRPAATTRRGLPSGCSA